MPPKSVAEEFVGHRLLSRVQHFPDSKDLPLPLDMEKYAKDDPPCQTTLCTNVAVEQYNAQQVESGKKIRGAVGVDSQMFVLSQDDPVSYWHLYFKGSVGRKKCKFFAELSGVGGPKELRTCVFVDKAIAASVVNCDHCFGGIWHPLQNFLGCKEEEEEEEEEHKKKKRKHGWVFKLDWLDSD
ncbi:uncharacterized protein LOC124684645 [Lolium rigidum]|uniref:uncharacterized protein LOC124684645 n=1 Tax=Lolium rigidum TaxID=89674 RepID=UPI001F5C9B42|nr:uncharacterized protein LOC124684645 [Lolium rigidum]